MAIHCRAAKNSLRGTLIVLVQVQGPLFLIVLVQVQGPLFLIVLVQVQGPLFLTRYRALSSSSRYRVMSSSWF